MSTLDTLVGTYSSRVEAELSCARLDSEGIRGRVASDDVGGAYPVLEGAGVYLYVATEDSALALEILERPPPEPTASPGDLGEAEAMVRGNVESTFGGGRLIRDGLFLMLGVLLGLFFARDQDATVHTAQSGVQGTVENDRNRDGRIDAWHDFDGEDYVRTRYDQNFDGVVDGWVTYESGNVAVYAADLDFNGIPDRTTEYEHDLPSVSRLHPNGGELAIEELFADGELREVYSVSDGGTRTLLRTYDEFGRVRAETP